MKTYFSIVKELKAKIEQANDDLLQAIEEYFGKINEYASTLEEEYDCEDESLDDVAVLALDLLNELWERQYRKNKYKAVKTVVLSEKSAKGVQKK